MIPVPIPASDMAVLKEERYYPSAPPRATKTARPLLGGARLSAPRRGARGWGVRGHAAELHSRL